MNFIRKILITSLMVLAPAPELGAQVPQSSDTVKIDTALVSVPVIVSDRQGRYIGNLAAKDFTLYDNRVKQQVSFFASIDEPINVALLLDTSKSTRDVLDDIKRTAVIFLRQLRPQDRAMVIAFDYDVHLLNPLTADRKALERSINRADIGYYAGTMLNDAVHETITRQFKNVNGRKAVVLLTDGKDVGSDIDSRQLIELAEESETMIYPIFYTTGMFAGRDIAGRFPFPQDRRGVWEQRRTRRNEIAAGFLQELADASAGRFYRSEVVDLERTFGLIAEELRHQYRLGFYPDENGGSDAHQLKVEVSRPDVVVRARRSYRMKSTE